MNNVTYRVYLAYLEFEVNTEVQAPEGISSDDLIDLAVSKIESYGFSCSQEEKPLIEYEEV